MAANPALTMDELCEFFEQLSDSRRELVWIRCRRLLGAPVDVFAPDDPQVDDAFEAVLRDMWVQEHLDRLVSLDVLERAADDEGRVLYRSC